MKTDQENIQQLVKEIVQAVKPQKIILFGSFARKEAKPESDIDVLVVMKDGTHRRKTARHLYEVIHGVEKPFDILVSTPTFLEEHQNNIGLIYHRILEEGKLIYAA